MIARLGRRTGVVVVAAATLSTPAAAHAHGVGGRADLPVPASFFAIGAGLVLVLTFVLLSTSWTEPRLQTATSATLRRPEWLQVAVAILRGTGLVSLGLVIVAGLLDGTGSALNAAPVLVFVYFWLVVPFVGAGIGDWWRWLSPWATLTTWVNGRRPERSDLVAKFGVWPAVLVFLGFTWLELVAPDNGPTTLGIAALTYTVFIVAAGWLVGPRSGLRLLEAFHTYNGLIARISPFDVAPDDAVGATKAASAPAIARRGWLRGLPATPEWPGLTVFIAAMIGTVSYDGLSGTEWWAELFPALRREPWFGTIALLAAVAVIWALYGSASWAAASLAGEGWTAGRVARRFAHTLVPIALAYAVAHYLTLVLFEGQLLLSAASDPLGRGWDLFGSADWSVSFFLSPEVVWYLQVLAIVAGHVAGVVLAHDRALADFGGEVAVRTQYAMLALMVTLTSLGLFVLAG